VALTAGLSTEEAVRRRQVFGPNQLKGRKPVHPVVLFLKHLINVMTVILFIALGLSLAVHEFIEASVIAFVIILNAVVGFVQEYGSEKTMQVRRQTVAAFVWIDLMDSDQINLTPPDSPINSGAPPADLPRGPRPPRRPRRRGEQGCHSWSN
jgi:magnesium-transporting ATPase (P-type)